MTTTAKSIALAAALIGAAGCTPRPAHMYATDYANNPYPNECRQDLAALTAQIPVVDVEPDKLARIAGQPVYGVYMNFRGLKFIYLDSNLSGWMRLEILHHERCHAFLDMSGKDPAWHKERH